MPDKNLALAPGLTVEPAPNGQFRWSWRSPEGEVHTAPTTHDSRVAAAADGRAWLKQRKLDAAEVTIDVFEERDGVWSWRVTTPTGSHEPTAAFPTREVAERSARRWVREHDQQRPLGKRVRRLRVARR